MTTGHGSLPLAILTSAVALLLFMNLGFGRLRNIGLVQFLQQLSFFIWVILGVSASFIVSRQSLKYMVRMGVMGSCRPRWWFEAARFLCIILLFLVLSLHMEVVFKAFNFFKQFNLAIAFGTFLGKYLFFAFLAAASMGYLLGFMKGWRFRGRAFECVHFIYIIFFSFFLIAYAESYWPPSNIWPEGTTMFLLGSTGIVILTFGFVSIVKQFEAYENSDSE